MLACQEARGDAGTSARKTISSLEICLPLVVIRHTGVDERTDGKVVNATATSRTVKESVTKCMMTNLIYTCLYSQRRKKREATRIFKLLTKLLYISLNVWESAIYL